MYTLVAFVTGNGYTISNTFYKYFQFTLHACLRTVRVGWSAQSRSTTTRWERTCKLHVPLENRTPLYLKQLQIEVKNNGRIFVLKTVTTAPPVVSCWIVPPLINTISYFSLPLLWVTRINNYFIGLASLFLFPDTALPIYPGLGPPLQCSDYS